MSKAVGRRREKYQRKRKYKGSIVILSFGAPSEAVLPNMVKKQLSFTKKLPMKLNTEKRALLVKLRCAKRVLISPLEAKMIPHVEWTEYDMK